MVETADSHVNDATGSDGKDYVRGLLFGELIPEHVRILRARALDDATIVASGIHSCPPTDYQRLAKLLGIEDWKAQKYRGGILIPYFTFGRELVKGFARFRPDSPYTPPGGKPYKYVSPKSAGVYIYHPPLDIYSNAVLDPRAALHIYESEFKALAGNAAGFPGPGLGGIYSWRATRDKDEFGNKLGDEQLHPDLVNLGLDNRTIKLIPDTDEKTNPKVRQQVWKLAQFLKKHGARVLVVRIPLQRGDE